MAAVSTAAIAQGEARTARVGIDGKAVVATESASTVAAAASVSKLTADHAKFESLKRRFDTASDVTKACLECHTEAGRQVTRSIHWTWETINLATGQTLGKKHVLNAFCGNLATNEPRCTSCHAGYGWENNANFDFTDESKIDCLACHDTTGDYVKWPTEAGHPLYSPRAADSVSSLSREPDCPGGRREGNAPAARSGEGRRPRRPPHPPELRQLPLLRWGWRQREARRSFLRADRSVTRCRRAHVFSRREHGLRRLPCRRAP